MKIKLKKVDTTDYNILKDVYIGWNGYTQTKVICILDDDNVRLLVEVVGVSFKEYKFNNDEKEKCFKKAQRILFDEFYIGYNPQTNVEVTCILDDYCVRYTVRRPGKRETRHEFGNDKKEF